MSRSSDPRRKPAESENSQPKSPRKNTKLTGERSESDFQSAAIHRNFGVARPWGDSRRYDFILDNGRYLCRVQVKCTESTSRSRRIPECHPATLPRSGYCRR